MKRLPLLLLVVLAGCGKPGAAATTVQEIPAIDVQAFGAFEYKEKMDLPADVMKWNGKVVKATGYINPGRQVRGISEFELVKDKGSCCFGSRPKMNHFFAVKMKQPETTDFSNDPVTVIGKLVVEDKWDGDWQLGLYWLNDVSVVKTQ